MCGRMQAQPAHSQESLQKQTLLCALARDPCRVPLPRYRAAMPAVPAGSPLAPAMGVRLPSLATA